MTDDDSIVFLRNGETARTNDSHITSIDTSSITASSIAASSIRSVQLYQPSYRYNYYTYDYYTYDYTNTYNKQSRKETPLLKKKVLSNPLFTLMEEKG